MKYLPQWTRKVAMKGTGRDPLGLSRVSDSLTNYLLPSIITTTDRARYYSFYTWVIAELQDLRESKGAKISFDQEFQRREAAFALASRIGQQHELPIVGIRQVDTRLAAADDEANLPTNFRVLPSNGTGGFGQYYAGCLRALGLVHVDEEEQWVVSSEQGRKIATAFSTATARALFRAEGWEGKARVPEKVLKQSSKLFCLDALSGPAAQQERHLLERLFFDLDHSPEALTPLNRQATLGLFLHVLRICNKVGVKVTRRNIDKRAIFWPHYFSGLQDDGHAFASYQTNPAFSRVQAFWRQFCAHQFLAFALEEVLAAVLNALEPYSAGLTKSALLDELEATEFVPDLQEVLRMDCSTPKALLVAIGVSTVPDYDASRSACRRFHGSAELNEWTVCWEEDTQPETRLGRAFLLIAILYSRWRSGGDDEALFEVQEVAGQEPWVGTVFPWVDGWLCDAPSWRDAVEELLDWVTIRHEKVKFQKRKLDASWFELANGRFVRQQDIEPGFRASRHGNAATILQDLGLIEHAGLDVPLKLTPRGREVLEEVIHLRS